MKEKYFPQEIEQKWQKHWADEKTFEVREDPERPEFYCLEMLAYTSGRAHIGHVSNYSIGDALAWYKRMRGFNVLHPFGWDAFGQPAETAAIKDGTDPEAFTRAAIATMKGQLQRMGISYDWSREVATCDPKYYKWNQWFFIRMFERGMLYRKLSPVNWCPKEDISLSNEQASGGTCWRCGTPVIQKELMQWFARITDYADQLLDGLDQLEGKWPDRVVAMQRNWIGRSRGAHVRFDIADTIDSVTVFTTRIDTIFGANAIILAPEHPLLTKIVEGKAQRDEVLAFAEALKREKRGGVQTEEQEKKGIFTGGYAVNPFNRERLPIWIANFVLMEYGTGAIMAVPSGDERDFEFSRKYGIPFRQIKLTADGREIPADEMTEADESWTVTVNTGRWSGLASEEANRMMTDYAEANGFGQGAITYKLRDWGISRQRYWGTPVPMIHCPSCGTVPVPDDQLPVVLPKGVNLAVSGGSPLDHVPEYVNATCPKCNGAALRDTDTMDTFVDSNWYYHRYCDPHNDAQPFDPAKVAYWLPVDQYIGGIEHAVMHLIYTRYWNRVMRDMGLVQFDEPVTRLLTQGMIVKESYRCPEHEWLFPEEVNEDKTCKFCGRPVMIGRLEKMSKSKKNAVDPIEMINIHGADALRLFVLFAGPPEKDKEWSDSGFDGAARYLQRVWRIAYKWQGRIINAAADAPSDTGEALSELQDYQRQLRRRVHQIVRAITENFEERLHLNTCISSLMEMTNAVYAFDQAVEKNGEATAADIAVAREAFEALIRMLAPFAPHISEELWESYGHAESLAYARWPEFDAELAREEEIEVAVQVNGKLRSRLFTSAEASDDDLRQAALADEKVTAAMADKTVVKVIVIPRKLVNVVVK
ncbi:MAG TPA: leucine--tRNA ligase [Blastocatellia bacterium]|nr:leucine--tRNA ligase [Blastocatellia bacterium]